jgi:hypothetical protein
LKSRKYKKIFLPFFNWFQKTRNFLSFPNFFLIFQDFYNRHNFLRFQVQTVWMLVNNWMKNRKDWNKKTVFALKGLRMNFISQRFSFFFLRYCSVTYLFENMCWMMIRNVRIVWDVRKYYTCFLVPIFRLIIKLPIF